MNPTDIEPLIDQALVWLQVEIAACQPLLRPLTPDEAELARATGVQRPELVRLGLVDRMPIPLEPALKQASVALGLFTEAMTALAAGYVVLIKQGHATPALLRHELRLVYHFEQAGSVEAYFRHYLSEVFQFGYGHTPMESDAAAVVAGQA